MKSLFSSMDEKTKGLTMTLIKVLIIIVAVMILFFIIAGLGGKNVSYDKLSNIASDAAERYMKKNNEQLPAEGENKRINISELVSNGYMKELSKYTNDTSCVGSVTVYNNGGIYLYITNLDCSNYKTRTIEDEIKSYTVESGDGLYHIGNEYYYKGQYINNYIKIDDTLYRILGIDENNNLKLISGTVEKTSVMWDNRFNYEKNQDSYGINDYERSILQQSLYERYNKLNSNTKKYILNYEWCIGKRSVSNTSINQIECSDKTNGYLSTIHVYEYMRASLDTRCTSIDSGACHNYNYFYEDYKGNYWTLTANADNTYESYAISSGEYGSSRNSKSKKVINSFYISGENVYNSGDGSISNPFIIK